MTGQDGATFAILLDGSPITWTALSRVWYRQHMGGTHLAAVVPIQFDRTEGMRREMATELLLWLREELPTWNGRLMLKADVPYIES